MAVGTALALGLGAASAIGGAISGGSDQTTSTRRDIAPAGSEERKLQEQSLQAYLQQMALANQYEGGIGSSQQLQDASRQQYMNILGGDAFNLTGSEMQRIGDLRSALVDQGGADVNRMLDERLKTLSADAGARGLRGQAYSELQGQALRAGAEQLGNTTRQANQIAAQEALQAPYRRLQAQQPYIGAGTTIADQMRIQAQSNRQQLQNPVMLQNRYNERIAGAGQTSTTPGSLGGAIGGALGGFGQGFGIGANVGSAFGGGGGGGGNNLWAGNTYSDTNRDQYLIA